MTGAGADFIPPIWARVVTSSLYNSSIPLEKIEHALKSNPIHSTPISAAKLTLW